MEMRPLVYDYAEFSLGNGESEYDVAVDVNALFKNVPVAKNVVIFFDQEISIKFNSTLMPEATLTIDKSPFQSPPRFLDLKNIYLTNASGFASTIQIWIW